MIELPRGILSAVRISISWNRLSGALFGASEAIRRRLAEWLEAGVWQQMYKTLLADLRAAGLLDLLVMPVGSICLRALTGVTRRAEHGRPTYTRLPARPDHRRTRYPARRRPDRRPPPATPPSWFCCPRPSYPSGAWPAMPRMGRTALRRPRHVPLPGLRPRHRPPDRPPRCRTRFRLEARSTGPRSVPSRGPPVSAGSVSTPNAEPASITPPSTWYVQSSA